MNETRRFSLRVVLTVTTGRLLTAPRGSSDNGISDLYDILGWMTNDSPFTHQLGRFADECKPWLRRWFPQLFTVGLLPLDIELAKADRLPAASRDVYRVGVIENWLKPLIADYGEFLDVPRIPRDDHAHKNPIDELVEMRGTEENILVIKSGTDSKESQ